MRRARYVQKTLVVSVGMLTAILLVVLGCSAPPKAADSSAAPSASPDMTSDGLVRINSDAPGDLFLRPDHGIGGYDAIVVAPAFVHYRRSSERLDPDDEELYLVMLEQALIDEANSIGAPIENRTGQCVIKVGIGFLNVDLARSASAKILGEMILVVEYQDSLSGESLLRMTVPKRIERESGGMSRGDQIAESFERMIDEVDLATAVRSATATPSKPRPGCQGRLVGAGLPSVAN